MPLIKKIQFGSFNGSLATSLYVTLSSTFCFSNTDISIRVTNSLFVSQCKISNHGLLFYIYIYLYSTNSSSDLNDTLVSGPQLENQNRKKTTCTILILGIAMIGNIHKNDTLHTMNYLGPSFKGCLACCSVTWGRREA